MKTTISKITLQLGWESKDDRALEMGFRSALRSARDTQAKILAGRKTADGELILGTIKSVADGVVTLTDATETKNFSVHMPVSVGGQTAYVNSTNRNTGEVGFSLEFGAVGPHSVPDTFQPGADLVAVGGLRAGDLYVAQIVPEVETQPLQFDHSDKSLEEAIIDGVADYFIKTGKNTDRARVSVSEFMGLVKSGRVLRGEAWLQSINQVTVVPHVDTPAQTVELLVGDQVVAIIKTSV